MIEFKENTFLTGYGISFSDRINKIIKSDNQLQPIFDTSTNSLESISLLWFIAKNYHKIK